MKRYIHASSSYHTSLAEAYDIIDSIPMTRKRRESLYAIQEWNISPEDVAVLAGSENNGMIKFKPNETVISVSYGHSGKADKVFILEYDNGTKRMYGWDIEQSTYDGSEVKYWIYLGRA